MNMIVTGASRGIGWETVLALAEQGNHRIFAIARNEKKLLDLQKNVKQSDVPSELIPIAADLTDQAGMDHIKEVLVKEEVLVNVIINNAGTIFKQHFGSITKEDFNQVFSVNLWAPVQLMQTLMDRMDNPAHVINISSMGGFQGSAKFPGLSIYSASKGALNILTECLAEELKDKNIAVNALAIGAVQTEMLSEAFPGYQAPLTAKQMGAYIADFAINGNCYYNGKILPVALSTP